MGKHLLTVHGHKVYCEDDRAFHGVKYLAYEIEEDACKELFQQAETGQQVDFEDDDHRKFSLVDGENGAFNVVTHEHHGWI
jgi:hypothetical protein